MKKTTKITLGAIAAVSALYVGGMAPVAMPSGIVGSVYAAPVALGDFSVEGNTYGTVTGINTNASATIQHTAKVNINVTGSALSTILGATPSTGQAYSGAAYAGVALSDFEKIAVITTNDSDEKAAQAAAAALEDTNIVLSGDTAYVAGLRIQYKDASKGWTDLTDGSSNYLTQIKAVTEKSAVLNGVDYRIFADDDKDAVIAFSKEGSDGSITKEYARIEYSVALSPVTAKVDGKTCLFANLKEAIENGMTDITINDSITISDNLNIAPETKITINEGVVVTIADSNTVTFSTAALKALENNGTIKFADGATTASVIDGGDFKSLINKYTVEQSIITVEEPEDEDGEATEVETKTTLVAATDAFYGDEIELADQDLIIEINDEKFELTGIVALGADGNEININFVKTVNEAEGIVSYSFSMPKEAVTIKYVYEAYEEPVVEDILIVNPETDKAIDSPVLGVTEEDIDEYEGIKKLVVKAGNEETFADVIAEYAAEYLEALGENGHLAGLYDITILDENDDLIHSLTGEGLKLTMLLPEGFADSLAELEEGKIRNLFVIRLHQDQGTGKWTIERLATEVAEDGTYLTFSSNLYSLFALAYEDVTPTPTPNPDEGGDIVNPGPGEGGEIVTPAPGEEGNNPFPGLNEGLNKDKPSNKVPEFVGDHGAFTNLESGAEASHTSSIVAAIAGVVAVVVAAVAKLFKKADDEQ